MKNISIWKDTVKKINYPELKENKTVDILIIGGGITGISLLYHLKNSKFKTILVEQNQIGYATTGNSTGKISYLQNDLINKIRNNYDDTIAAKYLKSQLDAINMIKNTIKKENICCELTLVNSQLYTNISKEIDQLKNFQAFLSNNKITTKNSNCNCVQYKYMFEVNNTYIFHPLKFIYGLLENNHYSIYENTSIKKIKKDGEYYLCNTNNAIIKAKWVVIASHYPYFLVPYLFPIKAGLEKSYLSASKSNHSSMSLISYSNPFISIRTYKNYLIYLSNSHYINTKVDDNNHFKELMQKTQRLNLHPNYLWSNTDIITNDGLPYIGRIKNNLLIGTGYNTWGLTSGFLAGKILSDLILQKENDYYKLFDPQRRKITNAAIINNIGKTIEGYWAGCINKNNKDINDRAYRCPHTGCKLLFNHIENTWDCPCHGSRFDHNGKCINGPSNKDIDIK